MQQKLGRPLLWNACCHHVGELILTWSWNFLEIEAPKGPEISVFQWYLEHFHKLSYSDLSDLYIPEIADELQPAKEEVVQLIKETLANKKFEYRGEYTTFMKYVYVYLTGDTTNFKFAEPGALSRARFMGKLLYAIPMVLMKDKISSEVGKEAVIMTVRQVELLERFVTFVCLVYAKYVHYQQNVASLICSYLRTSDPTQITSPLLQRKLSITICGTSQRSRRLMLYFPLSYQMTRRKISASSSSCTC